MRSIAVLKFGGSSVKSIARIQHVADLIATFPEEKKIVIVSAMGDTTDHLLKLAKQCSRIPNQRELDLLLATGEQVSIALLSITLAERGIRSRAFTGQQLGVLTDSNHNSARIIDLDKQCIDKALDEHDVVILAGFQGASAEGDITTLGRGGSDTSALAVAAAIKGASCHIFSDVDGVYSADPRKVSDAEFLPEITFSELIAMAQNGAQVMHPRAVQLAEDYQIEFRIRNTFNPSNPGTLVKGDDSLERINKFTAVSIDYNCAYIYIENLEEADASVLAETAAHHQLSTDAISYGKEDEQGKKSAQIVCKFSDKDRCLKFLQNISKQIPSCQANLDFDIARVNLIGKGLSTDFLSLTRLLSVLNSHSVPVRQINCNDIYISAVIPANKAEYAEKLLHNEFIKAQHSDSSKFSLQQASA